MAENNKAKKNEIKKSETKKGEVKKVVKEKATTTKPKKPNSKNDKVQIWVKKEKLAYEKELTRLQVELLKLQNHVKDKGL